MEGKTKEMIRIISGTLSLHPDNGALEGKQIVNGVQHLVQKEGLTERTASRPVSGMSYVTLTICQKGWKKCTEIGVQLRGREEKRQLLVASRLAFKSFVHTPSLSIHAPIKFNKYVL
jgi:hypothetical protein